MSENGQGAGRCGVDYHCPNGQHTAADLTPAQAARLEAIEAAPWSEAAAVERVARAIVEAKKAHNLSGFPCDCGWEAGFGAGWEDRVRQHRLAAQAVAAIDVMRGATDDGAVGRVLVLAATWEDCQETTAGGRVFRHCGREIRRAARETGQ